MDNPLDKKRHVDSFVVGDTITLTGDEVAVLFLPTNEMVVGVEEILAKQNALPEGFDVRT